MQNYIQPGVDLTLVAPSGGTVSGSPYLFGVGLFGVAATTAVAGDDVVIRTMGVFDLNKVSALVIAVGDLVYWDDTAKLVNKTNTNTLIGSAVAATANPSATVRVRLNV